MLEAINRICELAAEVTKAQIIIDNKDHQIEEMQKYINEQKEATGKMQEDYARLRQEAANRPSGPPDIPRV